MVGIKEYRGYQPAVIIGMSIGLIILFSSTLSVKWDISIVAGLVFCLSGILFVKQIETIAYASFIFFLPFQLGKSFFYSPYEGGGHELRINLSEIFFALLLVFWVRDILQKNQKFNKIDKRLLISGSLFLLISLLSLARALNVMLGVFELVRSVIAFLIFIYIASYVNSEKKLIRTITLLLYGAIIQIGSGLYQWIFEKDIGLYLFGEMGLSPDPWAEESIVRVGGLLGHPNAFATYLILTLPFSLFFFTREKNTLLKIGTFALMNVGILVLIATHSRGAWSGFGIGSIISFILFLLYAKNKGIKRLPVIVGLTATLLIVGSISAEVIYKRFTLDDSGSAMSRVTMAVDAWEIIQDNPLLGIGINNYSLAVPIYDITGIHREWHATTVHNLLLLIAAESGIFAFSAFVLFWIFILKKTYTLMKTPDPTYFILSIAVTLSLTSFFIVDLVDPSYRFYPVVQREIWLIAGLVAAANRLAIRPVDEKATI
jgi:putative inorganic carbon (hco3(-)) transporter